MILDLCLFSYNLISHSVILLKFVYFGFEKVQCDGGIENTFHRGTLTNHVNYAPV